MIVNQLDAQLSQDHFIRRYAKTRRRFAFSADTKADFEAWQAAFRPALAETLGLPLIAESCGLDDPTRPQARRIHDLETLEGGITREHWELQVEDDVWMPFHLVRPAGDDGATQRPLVVCPHGHHKPGVYAGIADSPEAEQRMLEGERDIALQAARQGYVAIAPTTRAFGATRLVRDDLRSNETDWTCRTIQMQNFLMGRTLAGERVWDVQRVIDWALHHLPVNAEEIICTGNSGGGTTTIYASAIEERISISLPSCSFCTYAGSIGLVWHCECNYVPGILNLGEMWEVAGLIAPRPFQAINGVTDDLFPIDAVREAYHGLKQIYTVAGHADRGRLYEGNGGHRYYSDGAWPFVREMLESAP